MREREILNSMTEINDRFVEEAAAVEEKRTEMKPSSKNKNKKRAFRWQSFAAGAGAAAGLALVCIVFAFTGFGFRMGSANSDSTVSAAVYNTAAVTTEAAEEYSFSADKAMAEPAEAEDSFGYKANGRDISSDNIAKQDLKLIYRADMYVQTLDFDKTVEELSALVEANDGYYQNATTENGGYYNTDYRYGYFTVRVPAENYKKFVNAVGDSCEVTSLNESVEDVGLQYFELESRLESLRIKEERLQSLLSQASQMSDIIELESALADTEYEISYYQSDLNRYDSLIGYSTVSINIEQVTRIENTVAQDMSFGARLARAFKNGASNFVDGLESFVINLSYSIFSILLTLVILAAIVIAVIVIIKSVRRKNAQKKSS